MRTGVQCPQIVYVREVRAKRKIKEISQWKELFFLTYNICSNTNQVLFTLFLFQEGKIAQCK